ncbi:hypothetical protein JKP88DRAFT_203970 [Tribonema minus]|uniref:NADH dehydrogenase [ubiquinone] 1 beta subcomplex subunit 9 n=1 Tax=Tribonema minus TaxID=303371 RepID=A0A835YJC3_9STRA|nr:hypothetical protein JKP88DRAFT_203970 [Tribonema minus]
MNASFRAVAERFRMAPESLTHKQEVCRLYRASLRLLDSWAVDRTVFLDEAEKIRDQFDANAALDARSGRARYLIANARASLRTYVHPDRYIPAYMPGGSLFMRNPALPLEVCYPNGIPEDVAKEMGGIELNIDMTYAKPGVKAKAGTLYVDLATKQMY